MSGVKIVACLSWYDERPEWLAECVESLAACCDHVVAVDGGYAMFPDATPRSDDKQAEAIKRAAARVGIGCTIHRPDVVWNGEVAKRAQMLALAETVAEPWVDWYFRIDADERIVSATDTERTLAATDKDVADVVLWTRSSDPRVIEWERQHGRHGPRHRFLFRAIPGLRVVGRHQAYVTPDGRDLGPTATPLEAAASVDCLVEHRTHLRTVDRQRDKIVYYNRVARLNAEGQDPTREPWSRERETDMGADYLFGVGNPGYLEAVGRARG